MKEKISLKHKLLIVAMAGMVGASVGLVQNIAGIFFDPIADDLNVGRGPVSFTLTIYVLMSAFSSLNFTKTIEKFGANLCVKVSAILLILGTLLSGFANNLFSLYLFNIIRGIGGGFIHLVTASLFINNWFEKRNGLMVSIAMAFSGAAGAICSPLLSNVVGSHGWKIGYLVNALIMFIMLIPILFFNITYTPQECGLKPYGYSETSENNTVTTNVSNKGKSTYVMMMIYAIIVGFMTCVPQFFPGHASNLNYAVTVGSLMISLSMVTNIIAKITAGELVDIFGSIKAIMFTSSLVLFGTILLLFSLHMYVGALLYGFCYAASTVGLTSITRSQYDSKEYAIKYPVLSFVSTIVNAVGSPIVGFMYDAFKTYRITFVMCLMMLVILFAILIMLKGKRKTI